MKIVKIILDFLFTVSSLFFRTRQKGRPCSPVVDGSGHSGGLPRQHGGGTGGCGGDTLALEGVAASSPTPVNLLGWGLIVSAGGSYLLRLGGWL